MPERIAKETLYYNADKTKLVKEGDAAAAFLFAREGTLIDESEAERIGYTGKTQDAKAYDAVADHTEKHAGETPEEAKAKRQRMLSKTGGDDDGPAVEGERDDVKAKSAAAPETKAVKAAPENKAVKAPAGDK
jgi:hypothetical protein